MLKNVMRVSHKVHIGEFQLESGELLPEVWIAVEIAGKLSPLKDNVILNCHALTGDTRAVGDLNSPGWWQGMIGPAGYINTERFAVVTMNALGGCGGSTGPASINPLTGHPYGSRFPRITIGDMVQAQKRCLEQLGISEIMAVIGGSMGGMLVLEWAVRFPNQVKKCIPIATGPNLSALSIGYNEIARQAIHSDPMWQQGDYYPGPGPVNGLAIARMVGMVSYRTEQLFEERFRTEKNEKKPMDEVGSYLRYQGEKLVRRFDANSYLLFLEAMNTFDLGCGRGGMEKAISQIQAEVFTIGITEDLYFPVRQQREFHTMCTQSKISSRYLEFSSSYGHDAFLVEYDKFGAQIKEFIEC